MLWLARLKATCSIPVFLSWQRETSGLYLNARRVLLKMFVKRFSSRCESLFCNMKDAFRGFQCPIGAVQ
jgi:hypothetical protein